MRVMRPSYFPNREVKVVIGLLAALPCFYRNSPLALWKRPPSPSINVQATVEVGLGDVGGMGRLALTPALITIYSSAHYTTAHSDALLV